MYIFELVIGEMEGFYVLISPDLLNSIEEFLNYKMLIDKMKSNEIIRLNHIELNVPSPAKSTSQYLDLNRKKSTRTDISTDEPRINYIYFISH